MNTGLGTLDSTYLSVVLFQRLDTLSPITYSYAAITNADSHEYVAENTPPLPWAIDIFTKLTPKQFGVSCFTDKQVEHKAEIFVLSYGWHSLAALTYS